MVTEMDACQIVEVGGLVQILATCPFPRLGA